MRVTVGGTGTAGRAAGRRRTGVVAAMVALTMPGALGAVATAPAGAAAPLPHSATGGPGAAGWAGPVAARARALPPAGEVMRGASGGADRRPSRSAATPAVTVNTPVCTYDGLPTGEVVGGVTPGSTVVIACTGWGPGATVQVAEFSPLFLDPSSSNANAEVDTADQRNVTADAAGTLHASFTVPARFSASDPAAVCPPSAAQISAGDLRCGIILADFASPPTILGVGLVALDYAVPAPTGAAAVGIAPTPDGKGYWLGWSNGAVTPHGDATWFGDASGLTLSAPIAHIVPTWDGNGYWLVAGDGGTFAYGDAPFYGSMGGARLNRPVVDLAPTLDGGGYWLVGSDGGVFAFGDAGFFGSMGGHPLNRPVVGLATDGATGGYWEVASDGGIFAFGAPFHGSTGDIALNRPINGMTATNDFGGYLFVASDGGVFAFGDAGFFGSAGSQTLAAPIVGMAVDPATDGYWLVGADGGVFGYNAPYLGAR